MRHYFSGIFLLHTAVQAIISGVLVCSLIASAFFLLEPNITRGQVATDDFIIRQTILSETSLFIANQTINMVGSVFGLTGGTANGSTTFSVLTTNPTGYRVDIRFDNAPAMRGNLDDGQQIRNFVDNAGTPSYAFTASTAPQFGYTVFSENASDTPLAFRNNGSTCGSGSQTLFQCWKAPTTSNYTVISRNVAATSGATSTLHFRVVVPSGANPVPTAQTYTATATLSVFLQ